MNLGTERELPDEAVFFRRDQNDLDDLEIAHIERRVAEATHVLEEAKRDLREAKMRIRNRRLEERQRGRGNHSHPEFVRPSVEDERVGFALPFGDTLRCSPIFIFFWIRRAVCESCAITCLLVEKEHLLQCLNHH